MASNSLFSTVTPCQQNFFWGKYCCLCLELGQGALGHGEDSRSGAEVWIEELREVLGKGDSSLGSD